MEHALCWEHVAWNGARDYCSYHPTESLALTAEHGWMVPCAPKQPHSPCPWKGQHRSNSGGKTREHSQSDRAGPTASRMLGASPGLHNGAMSILCKGRLV